MPVPESSPSWARLRLWRAPAPLGGVGLPPTARAAVAVCLALSASSCSSRSGAAAIDGELVSYAVTYKDGRSDRLFALRGGDGHLQPLVFDSPPSLPPRTPIRVWGEPDAPSVVHVLDYDVIAPVTTDVGHVASALATGAPKQETYAFVLVDLGRGLDLTVAQAQQLVFGTSSTGKPTFKQYYESDSYGALQITGDVVGPFSYPLSSANWSNCALANDAAGISQMTLALTPKIAKKYDHYMFYLGPGSGCGWGGISEEGTAVKPGVNAWYADSVGCGATEHEVGHNHGLFHENSLTCANGQVLADTPMGACTSYEYGYGGPPTVSVMGSACGHTNAWETWYEQWFSGCNGVRVKSSGTFTLVPIEAPCAGIQALQIPMPKARPFQSTQAGPGQYVPLAYYYLELREPVGMDSWVKQPTVFVHAGADIPGPTKAGNWTWVLDMDPGTAKTTDGLAVGKTFTDPAGGLSFTLTAIGADSATIDVVVANGTGPSTCMDGSPVTSPGPSRCDADAGAAPDGGPVDGGVAVGADAGDAQRGQGLDAAGTGSGGGDDATAVTGPTPPAGSDAGEASAGEATESGVASGGSERGRMPPVASADASSASGVTPGESPGAAAPTGGCGCESAGDRRPAPVPAALTATLALGLVRSRRRKATRRPS